VIFEVGEESIGMKQFLSIQYLRALAAISVAVFHEAERIDHHWPILTAGVDLFFVVSGFIMFVVTETNEAEPRVFLWRRVTRIVPLYWCATLVTVLFCRMRPYLWEGVPVTFAHVVRSLLFIPQTSALEDGVPVVRQGWTLNIEMFFYVVVAIALFFPRRVQLHLISFFLVSLVFAGAWFDPQTGFLRNYTYGLLLEFTAGLWLGRLWALDRLPSCGTGAVSLAMGFIALGIDAWIGHHGGKLFRPFFWGVPVALIVLGALSIEVKGRVLHVPLLKTLGDASYSIYLLHDMVEVAMNRLPLALLPKATLSIVMVAIVGIVAFKWFEQPVNAAVRKIGGV
jgi:exopolysaccharide production protein ExoZ